MAYDALSLPLPSPNDISLTSVFRDDAGGKVGALEVDNTGLHATAAGSPAAVDDIWFQYSFDARTIPDGYWDLMVTMRNYFEEPGNTWILRVRVEKGPPDPPTDFIATATSDTTVSLTWLPGTEQDRARYVLERMEVDAGGTPLSAWTPVTVDPAVSQRARQYPVPPHRHLHRRRVARPDGRSAQRHSPLWPSLAGSPSLLPVPRIRGRYGRAVGARVRWP